MEPLHALCSAVWAAAAPPAPPPPLAPPPSPAIVVASVVGAACVLTIIAIAIATTALSRRASRDVETSDAGAGSKAAGALVASLLHVVPISVAQASDYASDVIVATSMLLSEDDQALGWIAVGALGLSLLFAWVSLVGFACAGTWTPYGRDKQLEPHQLLVAMLLAPFNLHVLYLGVVYSREVATTRGRNNPRYANAGWYFMFVTLKLLETSVESVPLAVVVVAAIVAGGGAGSVLLWASLSITCLSMSYGLFLQAMDNASDDGKTQAKHKGRRLEIFLCVLIHLAWAVAAVGCAMGTTALGVGRWIAPAALLLLGLLQAVVAVGVEGGGDRRSQQLRSLHVNSFAGSVIDLPILFGGDCGDLASDSDHLWKRFLIYVTRRLALAGCAAASLAFAWSPGRAALLGSLLLLDTLAASPRLCRHFDLGFLAPDDESILRLKYDGVDLLYLLLSPLRLAPRLLALLALPLVRLRRILGRPTAVAPSSPMPGVRDAIEPITGGGRDQVAWVHDAIEPIIGGASAAAGKAGPELAEALSSLRTACKALDARLEQASAAELSAARTSLIAYTPSEDGTAESKLQALLSAPAASAPPPVVDAPRAAEAEAGGAPAAAPHPVRGVLLAAALSLRLWVTVPSFFGRRVEGTNWTLSHTVDRVDWFVSHAWIDGGARKVAMLREVCFLQSFVARLLVVGMLLALFFGVCGLAIEEVAPAFPWWTLFAASGTAVATLLAWVVLSVVSVVPSRLAPWATSGTTLWIDKCCIDQTSPATIQSGVDSFGRFVESSDGMVAFVSLKYFSRLWCVFELATFCKKHQGDKLHEKLLLLSPGWPSSLSPLKAFFSPGLTDQEREVLAGFRCREARCFKPCDRATVLASVRHDWGSEAAFDAFVQKDLVKVLEESKTRYSTRLAQVMSETLELTFGD